MELICYVDNKPFENLAKLKYFGHDCIKSKLLSQRR